MSVTGQLAGRCSNHCKGISGNNWLVEGGRVIQKKNIDIFGNGDTKLSCFGLLNHSLTYFV